MSLFADFCRFIEKKLDLDFSSSFYFNQDKLNSLKNCLISKFNSKNTFHNFDGFFPLEFIEKLYNFYTKQYIAEINALNNIEMSYRPENKVCICLVDIDGSFSKFFILNIFYKFKKFKLMMQSNKFLKNQKKSYSVQIFSA